MEVKVRYAQIILSHFSQSFSSSVSLIYSLKIVLTSPSTVSSYCIKHPPEEHSRGCLLFVYLTSCYQEIVSPQTLLKDVKDFIWVSGINVVNFIFLMHCFWSLMSQLTSLNLLLSLLPWTRNLISQIHRDQINISVCFTQ